MSRRELMSASMSPARAAVAESVARVATCMRHIADGMDWMWKESGLMLSRLT